jgi:hypothetical protein
MRFALAMLLSLLLASSGSSPTRAVTGLICALTGKRIEACCCQMKDGKLYCPLAKKYIHGSRNLSYFRRGTFERI